MKRELTDKQQAFVAEYLIDLNATQAAIRAEYSEKTAKFIGPQLLKKTHIRAAVDKAMSARAKKADISAERVLLEVARLSFFDPRRLFRADGTPRPIHELDDDTAAAIAGIDVSTTRTDEGESSVVMKYKLAGKDASLEKLMRHLGLYKTDNEQGAQALESLLRGARSRKVKRE